MYHSFSKEKLALRDITSTRESRFLLKITISIGKRGYLQPTPRNSKFGFHFSLYPLLLLCTVVNLYPFFNKKKNILVNSHAQKKEVRFIAELLHLPKKYSDLRRSSFHAEKNEMQIIWDGKYEASPYQTAPSCFFLQYFSIRKLICLSKK